MSKRDELADFFDELSKGIRSGRFNVIDVRQSIASNMESDLHIKWACTEPKHLKIGTMRKVEDDGAKADTATLGSPEWCSQLDKRLNEMSREELQEFDEWRRSRLNR